MKPRLVLPLLLAAALAVPPLALAAFRAPEAPAAPAPITVTMTEMKFKFSKAVAKRGTVVFKLVNKGMVDHDIKIAGKKSPKVKPGKTVTWRVVIKKPGRYPAICTLPGHAPAGMKAVFRVR